MKFTIFALALSISLSSFASDFCTTAYKARGKELDRINKLLEKEVDLTNVEKANEVDEIAQKALELEELFVQVDKYCQNRK